MKHNKKKIYLGKSSYSSTYFHGKYGSQKESPVIDDQTKDKVCLEKVCETCERRNWENIGFSFSIPFSIFTFILSLSVVLHRSTYLNHITKITFASINSFIGSLSSIGLTFSLESNSRAPFNCFSCLIKYPILILLILFPTITFILVVSDDYLLSCISIPLSILLFSLASIHIL
jgi:hypothetical protein